MGVLYSSNEVNSQVQCDLAIEKAKAMGMSTATQTITSVNDITNAVIDDISVVLEEVAGGNLTVGVANEAIYVGVFSRIIVSLKKYLIAALVG